jgi:hypothetical protein
MSPKEVQGLQALAMAHGGSLTINPQTGLPEAGFLQNILPTLLGAGLTFISGGALSPLMAAGLVGGGTALASGDLKKGLMAGLGAYGGAGIYGAMNPAAMATEGASSAISTAAPTSIVPNAPAIASPAAMSPANIATKLDLTPSFTPAAQSFKDAAMSKYGAAAAGSILGGSDDNKVPTPDSPGLIRPYVFDRTKNASAFQDVDGEPLSSKERRYFTDQYTALPSYKAPGPEYMAAGGPVEQMSDNAAIGANTMYPMANIRTSSFATPYQDPRSTNMMANMDQYGGGTVGQMSGEPNMQGTRLAGGGEVQRFGMGGALNEGMFGSVGEMVKKVLGEQQSNGSNQYTYDPKTQQYTEVQQGTSMPYMAAGGALGGYSDGGRMLKGPGDGMSDNIPAVIGKKQPARLADGEFVVPADVVSHLGNGSTSAGAKQLYAMMDRIRDARTGTKKQGKQINPRKYMSA